MYAKNNLERFTEAQKNTWGDALSEVRHGRKRTHWMWFIFPQIKGLGFSETSQFYGIKDLAEAEGYLAHPVLGARLIEICHALLENTGSSATAIFGQPDDLKLHSSMTLFSEIKNADPVFELILDRFFQGRKDTQTLQLLESA